ncbi:MAG: beta-eliminating lyase-related protein [Microthrixaceae bacterium]|nr:beta-eliminating lyase-related protein [Microthrixaceae bacterium]
MRQLHFASDNNAGVAPPVLDAVVAEAARTDAAYGWDSTSQRMEEALADVFERPVEVFCVPTGTAANALCLAATNPVWGGVVCHERAHIVVDECAAPTALGGGLTLLPVPAEHGRLEAGAVAAFLDARHDTGVHSVPATSISITQATEAGTRYAPDDIAALADLAHGRGMALHMDGARFANAVAAAGSTPAELSWRSGVDIMSLGATKGGALAAEAIVAFDESRREPLERLRKRSGHLLSKQRFAAAQFNAWFESGRWLGLADHANQQAQRLAEGLTAIGVPLAHPVEANIVFADLEPAAIDNARAAGAQFYMDDPVANPDGTRRIRLVTSWSTEPDDVDALLAALSAMM